MTDARNFQELVEAAVQGPATGAQVSQTIIEAAVEAKAPVAVYQDLVEAGITKVVPAQVNQQIVEVAVLKALAGWVTLGDVFDGYLTGTQSWTAEIVIEPVALQGWIFGKGAGEASQISLELNATGKFNIRRGATTQTNQGAATTTGARTHLALRYDGTNVKLYQNGSETATFAESTNIVNTTGPWIIGSKTANLYEDAHFAGKLDEFAFYYAALDPVDIAFHAMQVIP